MRYGISVALVLMAGPLLAQPARVTSGDHDGFSRLVVELPGASDWQLGRTPDGYALSVTDAPDGYDLAGVFDLIQRDRLALVSVDAATGNLLFGLACACHAIPFEFRPGIIVIDIRDGAPRDGSSFEQRLPDAPPPVEAEAIADGEEAPQPVAVMQDTTTTPPAKPSRWVFSTPPVANRFPETASEAQDAQRPWPALDTALDAAAKVSPEIPPRNMSVPSAPMTALRDDLLLQISRGAARGVVDLAAAVPRTEDPGPEPAAPGFAQVVIDPVPGMSAGTSDDPSASLTPDGTKCIADDRLNIAEWGRDGPVAAQISTLTTGLVGEFDAVNADAVGNAVRYALHLGFGVEAGRLTQVFPTPDLASEAPVWTSMGRIIDGYPDPSGVFAEMLTCDTAAALWAVLAVDRLESGTPMNTQATLRSFSALPLHLRLALGPALATRFLEIGQNDVAQTIRDAIARAPAGAGHEADLIGAKLDLSNGNHQGAADLAQGVIADAGPGVAEAMIALVRSDLAQGKPVDAGTTDALAALLRENEGATLEDQLTDALILALASGGNADAAFARLPEHPASEPALWAALAASGSDDDILKHAITAAGTTPEGTTTVTRTQIAQRLQALGFPEHVALWQGTAVRSGDQATVADAAPQPQTPALDPAAIAQHVRIAARDWDGLAKDGSAPWQGAARHVVPDPSAATDLPPLAEATALLEVAASTRGDMAALLSAVASPASRKPSANP